MTTSKRIIESLQGRTIEIQKQPEGMVQVTTSFLDYRFYKLMIDRKPFMYMERRNDKFIFETWFQYGQIKTMEELTEYLTEKLEIYEQQIIGDTNAN